MAWPQAQAVLLDRRERSGTFLREALEALALTDRVTIEVAEAEEAARRPDLRAQFDLVVARSFAPPAVTAECAVGFLQAGAHLAVTEPPEGGSSRWDPDGLTQLGLEGPTIVKEGETTAAILTATGTPADQWPRRPGVPRKRPLW